MMKPDLSLQLPSLDSWGRVHFIGIGGAGMSALAHIMRARGITVSGSDKSDGETIAALRAAGTTVFIGHQGEHVTGAGTVVVSTAVRDENPEVVAARAAGIPVVHRSQALAALMAGRTAIAVAGTHGKTTTTSMISVALQHAGADPSFAIGGQLTGTSISAAHGSGPVFVAEADESDGSFLAYQPQVAVITNVESDHLDHYGTAEAVTQAFVDFTCRIVSGGTLVVCADDPGAAAIAERAQQLRGGDIRIHRYGLDESADTQIIDVDDSGPYMAFRLCDSHGSTVGPISLQVPGFHNVRNATAAWIAATTVGADSDAIVAGLGEFSGTHRRFETKGVARDIHVVDDYAHHPTEVAAVLAAARQAAGEGRVIAIFQPHLYSRTKFFAAEFAQVLHAADYVIVLDVYAAREDPQPGVTGELITSQLAAEADRVRFIPGPDEAVRQAVAWAQPGDWVFTIGAGDVTQLGPRIVAALES